MESQVNGQQDQHSENQKIAFLQVEEDHSDRREVQRLLSEVGAHDKLPDESQHDNVQFRDREFHEDSIGESNIEAKDTERPKLEPLQDSPRSGDVAVSLELIDVVRSIHETFPLLQAAYQERGVTAGNRNAALGSFDLQLKASSENQPLGFYETYRHTVGVTQPLFNGGEVFGGYRNGRGDFEPWYLERETNDGGEFRAGVHVPLARNREIDARRAEFWRANYDLQRAEPEIRQQLIQFVRDGSVAYWSWVAAGLRYRVGERALTLAQQRNEQIERQVDLGDVDPPVLQDNLRAIAEREAKLIELRRKLQQSAISVSLFYRSPDGLPLIPEESQHWQFPNPLGIQERQVETDITSAMTARPEITLIDLLAKRLEVDLCEARNDLQPAVDGRLLGSQDVGAPTSPTRDKSELEMELGVFVDVPIQRRKALGKIQSARSKISQLCARRQFMQDKIASEIRLLYAAIQAAYERLQKARESMRLAEYMADVERRKLELGASDLLSVVLREQIAIEAAESEIAALQEYFVATAEYSSALAREWPVENN